MRYLLLAVVLLGACAPFQTPENLEPAADGGAYQAQYRVERDAIRDARNLRSAKLNAERCTAAHKFGTGRTDVPTHEFLSPGDLVQVEVGGDAVFSGDFVVSQSGAIQLPYLNDVPAAGTIVSRVTAMLASRLVEEGYYLQRPPVSVRIMSFAAARVHVSGAVWEPGAVDVGVVAGSERDTRREAALGAATEGRNISLALRAAGGIRPDANLAGVVVRRGDQRIILDLRGVMEGRRFPDIMLLAGDEIEVPSRGCFQEQLMAPSVVTTPGVKVFLSNLTKPADANALSAIGKDVRELRYGTRFLQAAVGMNCVGGTQATNADRYIVLFSRNPISGTSVVIERQIEDLLRRADRDDLDPFLLPGDAIACYDSTVTNITEVARAVGQVTGTAFLLGL